jgi:hypothetical protein
MRILGRLLLWVAAALWFVAGTGGIFIALGILPPLLSRPSTAVPIVKGIPLVIDMAKVRSEATAFKKLKIFEEAHIKSIHEDILQKENILRNESEQIKRAEASQKNISAQLTKQKEAFEKKLVMMEEVVLKARQSLEDKVNYGYNIIRDQFKKVLKEIASRYNARIIIDTSTVLYAEGIDVTSLAINELDKKTLDFDIK